MSVFDTTNKRLERVRARMPAFPVELIRLQRMTTHLHKSVRDLTNAALKCHDLVETSYLVLALLYGTEDETCTASTLGTACHEKPANLTRLCNDLELRGLIHRGMRPGDRRSRLISLTALGRSTVEAAMPDVWSKTTHIYDGFSAAELQQLQSLLERQLLNVSKIKLKSC